VTAFDLVVLLIPGLPLAAALATGCGALLSDRYPRRLIERSTAGAILASFVAALWVLAQVVGDPRPREVTVYRWLASGDFGVDIAFLIDPLSAVMVAMVTGISFVVAVFSINYMHNERGFARFFAVLSLFVFAMLVLVMGSSYVLLFLGWEGVGICSYLLIGFYQDRRSAAGAATQAFVMNRVGDVGFLVGILLIVTTFGSADYAVVFAGAPDLDRGLASAIGLALLLGAIGKSAQLPLASWLPRAMEGPTPSSALIHAATMVTAGVYLVARSHPLYERAPDALLVVGLVGAATALYGGVVGLVQTDIKSVLAFSTTSQLGLMFLACGLGAYAVAIFHLVAHAFFKTLLFLTAPSILHHLHGGADPQAEGGRWRIGLPHRLFVGAAVAVAAVPFVAAWAQAGAVARSGAPILLAGGGIALFAAAFASRRMVAVTFGGHAGEAHGHGTRPPVAVSLIAVSLIALAGVALGLLPGGLDGSWWRAILGPAVPASSELPAAHPVFGVIFLGALALLLVAGWLTPLLFDRFRPDRPAPLPAAGALYAAALERFWLDELIARFVIRPVRRLALRLDRLDAWLDRATGIPEVAPPRRGVPVPGVEVPALAHEQPGILGVLTRVGANASSSLELRSARGAAGAPYWLTRLAAGAAQWIEVKVVGRVIAGITRSADRSAGLSLWSEREIIDRVSGLIPLLADRLARLSAAVEEAVFHRGVHLGAPRASAAAARVLVTTEEVLGRPLVFAGLILGSLVLAAVGALVLSSR